MTVGTIAGIELNSSMSRRFSPKIKSMTHNTTYWIKTSIQKTRLKRIANIRYEFLFDSGIPIYLK